MLVSDLKVVLDFPNAMLSTEQERKLVNDAEALKKLNEFQLAQLRRKFITREYPTVRVCGHKYNNQAPHSNCPACWNAYFLCNETAFPGALKVNTDAGPEKAVDALTAKFGKKWAKQFFRFTQWFMKLRLEEQQAKEEAESTNTDTTNQPAEAAA